MNIFAQLHPAAYGQLRYDEYNCNYWHKECFGYTRSLLNIVVKLLRSSSKIALAQRNIAAKVRDETNCGSHPQNGKGGRSSAESCIVCYFTMYLVTT